MSPVRVVLLGASNLTLALPLTVEIAMELLGGPLEVHVASGHGRSYGMRSGVLFRSLPPIIDCGIWSALSSRNGVRTFAVITDIGNDIPYGAPVDSIASWVRDCILRLREARARIVMTSLPLSTLQAIGPFRFRALQTLLFPLRRISFEQTASRLAELQRRLEALGSEFDLPLVEPRREWFGIDPIHIRGTARSAAWFEILSNWSQAEAPAVKRSMTPARLSTITRCSLYLHAPQRWWLFGKELERRQPACCLDDGTTVSSY